MAFDVIVAVPPVPTADAPIGVAPSKNVIIPPGVPMAGISGRLAAACIMRDYASIAGYRPMAMPGGISMP